MIISVLVYVKSTENAHKVVHFEGGKDAGESGAFGRFVGLVVYDRDAWEPFARGKLVEDSGRPNSHRFSPPCVFWVQTSSGTQVHRKVQHSVALRAS